MPPKKKSKRKAAKAKPTKIKKTKKTKKTKAVAKSKATKRAGKKKKSSPQPRRISEPQTRTKLWSGTGPTAARRSADFQGLSKSERADSQSVDELVEEGNAFEAGAVAGVEEADDADEQEVHTHEVPEDDVPEEYLDDK